MELLERIEVAEIKSVLNHEGLRFIDFALTEIDTTAPKSDELLPFLGRYTTAMVTIMTRTSPH